MKKFVLATVFSLFAFEASANMGCRTPYSDDNLTFVWNFAKRNAAQCTITENPNTMSCTAMNIHIMVSFEVKEIRGTWRLCDWVVLDLQNTQRLFD